MSHPNSRDQAFVKYLQGLLDDPGAMASLRRGLGKPPGHAHEMHRYVLPWLSEDAPPWEEEPLYLTASFFAYWHQGKTDSDLPVQDSPRTIKERSRTAT